MGLKDTVEQVIDPDSLEELDTREVDVPYGGVDGAKQPVQKKQGCGEIMDCNDG